MEVGIYLSALAFGFATGFHCIGMCGPIALSMGMTKSQSINFQIQNLTYNLGRIVTYGILGAILGIIGEGFELAGVQSALTIAVGVLLIIMAFFSFGNTDFASKIPFLSKFLLKVKMNLGKFLQKSDLKSRFFTGILNGFLPCGMVYIALTASLAAGGIWESALYMILFGLGTIPFMFAVVFLGNIMTAAFRLKMLKVIPVILLILGSLFVLRGLEIGIPLVSPKKEALQIQQNNSKDHQPSNHQSCH